MASFVDIPFVKEYTIIDENIDDKYIRLAIKEAQEIEIRSYIGSGLYDEIDNGITAGNLSALNIILLDSYIIPALIKWTVYRLSPWLAFKFTNKNIVRKNSDNSSSIDFNELDKITEQLRNDAEYYSNRLVKYLNENSINYPKYLNPGTGMDTIYPKTNSFTCSIYLG